jgi:glycosyltransferase involved in cell wall biosynthesis
LVTNWKLKNVCYFFPGAGIPLETSRYPWARIFSGIFDLWFLSAALKADVLAAAADSDAIAALKKRCGGILKNKKVFFLSSRIDTRIFKKEDKFKTRDELGFNRDKLIFVTTGRIHYTKGWRFLLQMLVEYKNINDNFLFVFVGDGGDRKEMESVINNYNIKDNVYITGFQPPRMVAKYIQASDLFLFGSQKEGWSTSLIEALACHKPIVTTRVSSASSMVIDGINGFVVEQNDLGGFIVSIEKALRLKDYNNYTEREIPKYSLDTLAESLGEIWHPAKL